MIVPAALLAAYDQARPFLQYIRENANATVMKFSMDENVPVSSRIKTIESVAEKIETGRFNSFADLDDLVAFTLVVPNRFRVTEITKFLSSVFNVHDIREGSKFDKSPDIFRFDSTRLKCSLKRVEGSLASPGLDAYSIYFEVQIRTVFEHAWAVATHDLTYKSNVIDWRRLRVAAQLKAIVESLDASVAAFDALAEAIQPNPWPALNDKLLVQRETTKLFESGLLSDEHRPKDLSRYCDNIVDLVRSVRPRTAVEHCLHSFLKELQSDSLHPIPRSLSLYQMFLGVLCRTGKLEGARNFPYHITQELVTIFPEVRSIRSTFSYHV